MYVCIYNIADILEKMECIVIAFKYLSKWLVTLMMLCFTLLCIYYFLFKNISLASNSSIIRVVNSVTISHLKSSPFNIANKKGTILLWTKVYIAFPRHVSCGQYNCELTRDRNKLQLSDIIVFNARFAKGREYLSTFTLKK